MSLPNPGMSFSPFAILTAEEMNDLVENIESLADGSGLDNDSVTADKIDFTSVGAGAGIWWEELGRATRSTAGDTLDITFTAKKYLRVLLNVLSSNSTFVLLTFNNDTSTNYAFSYSLFTGNYGNATSQSSVGLQPGTALGNNDTFQAAIDINNIATKGKNFLIDAHLTGQSAASFSLPIKFWGHWANTSNQINRITITNSNTGDFAIGSEIIVLGHD